MKIEYKNIEGGVVQVTTTDERFYLVDNKFFPSVSWISSFYPRGRGYEIWLAKQGLEEAEIIKKEAGDKGSLIHQAIAELLAGKTINHDSVFTIDGVDKEVSPDEYESIISFASWYAINKPETLAYDFTVFNSKEEYAGTLDWICKIGEQVYVIEFKTSPDIYTSHKLQVSAYLHSDYITSHYPGAKAAILQVGYRRNKNKYKFTDVEDCFELFLVTKKIFENEVSEKQPLQREFPLSVTLGGEDAILTTEKKLPKIN